MNHNFKRFILLLLCTSNSLYGVTLVYNLRVRRIFSISLILEQIKKPKLILSAVPIFFRRTSNIVNKMTNTNVCEKRTAGGSLLNARYVFSKHWFAEITTGIEKDHGIFTGTTPFCASRTGFDDVVLTAGYRHFIAKKVQGIIYGLVGFPTRKKVTLADRFGPLVGTRFNNMGFGLEGSYSFISELKQSLSAIIQTRLIHGFNRKWFPILPRGATIQPGNFTDILGVFQYRKKKTVFEAGYDLTIFSQQGSNLPSQEIRVPTFVRHSWFATVKHIILKAMFNKPFVFGAGFNINRANKFDAKAFAGWVFGAIVF